MLHNLRECLDTKRVLEARRREDRTGRKEQAVYESILDLCRAGEIDTRRVSLRGMYEAFVGREALEALNPRSKAASGVTLLEAGENPVNTAAFSNIFGQITYATVMDAMEGPEFIADQLVTTEPAQTQQPEIVPGVSMLGDVASDTGEGEEYPEVGVSEEYITIPRKVKDGFTVSLTDETVWEDNTGLVMQRVNKGAESIGITREKEILDACLGITTSYSRNGGAEQATYGNTHTQGDFDNLSATTGLEDYSDIETALLLFDAITDPNTGEPVMLSGSLQIVVPTALEFTLLKILNSTEVREVTNTNTTTLSGNPLKTQTRRQFSPVTSQYVKDRTSSASTWFIGDFPGAFGYREIYPIQVERESQRNLKRDIQAMVRVRRKGVPYVREPRKVVKATA